MLSLFGKFACSRLSSETVRALHTTASVSAGGRYRESLMKERHMNRFRVFADSPCWSRLDGRPAPLNNRQRMRYELQVNYNKRVQDLLNQVDHAVVATAEKKAQYQQNKERIIASKLKSKAKRWAED